MRDGSRGKRAEELKAQNKLSLIAKAKRGLWKLLNLQNKRHLIFEDSQYIQKVFAVFQKKNLKSLEFGEGLVQGEFQGVGYLLRMRPGNWIESSVFVSGAWEGHLLALMSGYLRQGGGIFVDVGANVGATSIPLARRFPDTTFHLFEPHPEIFSDLQNNCRINGLANVILTNSAVSDLEAGKLTFFAQKSTSNMGLSSLKRNPDILDFDEIQVGNTGLDAILREAKRKVSIVKIDTQGSELSVLKSARQTIARDRPVVFFEFESDNFATEADETTAKKEIMRFFGELGYKLYGINAAIPYYPMVNLESYYNGDIVAVPMSD